MITIPVYDLLMLPEVTFYFKKDMLFGNSVTSENVGEDVLFLMLKTKVKRDGISTESVFPIGISGRIENVDDEGNVRISSCQRVEISDVHVSPSEITASASACCEIEDITEEEAEDKLKQVKQALLQFTKSFRWGVWVRGSILHWRNFHELICALSGYMNISWKKKYLILETASKRHRYELIEKAVYELIELFKVSAEAENNQKTANEQLYRESAIKGQIEFLQGQLDEMHPENVSDIRRFEIKIQDSGMNEEAKREAEKVLRRIKQEGKNSHEYGALYDYLDFLTNLSWKIAGTSKIDLKNAEKVLDEDHYGLKKVKDRIIQQLAVMALNGRQSGSILLFVGAPGTGKTSIGQSIAKALQREYVRVSLGGIRDEAEIRGHRRTYVGAMPGRIMEGMKRSGVQNPVMVLDEVDKLAKDYGGDPASALLEVLDPEQNYSFTDHYMNVPYDLSNVLFVCTANSVDTIPEPLLNRMEVIQFPGYTPIEKFHIARNHLLPKAMAEKGITSSDIEIADQAIQKMVDDYTAEAGVRGLKKQIDTLCRFIAVKMVKNEEKYVTVNESNLSQFLGKKPIRHDKVMAETVPGVVTGLAWTRAGGEILFIETAFVNGKGNVVITGQLGDVMKESVQIAITLVKSMFPEYAGKFAEHDLHIHVPSGAVPKDGPSAGIALVTALSSLVSSKSVSVQDAMTGEISLRGTVMPIGGLPEKLMAAQRAGIERVFIPYENTEDLEDVSEEIRAKLEIVPVKRVREVLKMVLTEMEQ
ncbi:MAG: endopeptidase La [Lachnospiraceae bacterium]|nr:endopeptidase La [Lachnospiraceae bacterium]